MRKLQIQLNIPGLTYAYNCNTQIYVHVPWNIYQQMFLMWKLEQKMSNHRSNPGAKESSWKDSLKSHIISTHKSNPKVPISLSCQSKNITPRRKSKEPFIKP